MAESCVEVYRCCGTYIPGWLNGSHPTVNEGAVQRRVCFSYYVYGDCCSLSTYIRVRNCGGFYVYQLKPLTVCNSRYCGNGYVSSTPTTPGTLFPFFFFFFILKRTHQAFIDETNNGNTVYLHNYDENERHFFLAYCHPYSPQINSNQTALNDNCMVEALTKTAKNIYRGYCTAAQRYEISLRVLKNIFRCAHS